MIGCNEGMQLKAACFFGAKRIINPIFRHDKKGDIPT